MKRKNRERNGSENFKLNYKEVKISLRSGSVGTLPGETLSNGFGQYCWTKNRLHGERKWTSLIDISGGYGSQCQSQTLTLALSLALALALILTLILALTLTDSNSDSDLMYI